MLVRILWAAFVLGTAAGCGASQAPAPSTASVAGSALSVSVSPIDHWHVFNAKKLLVTVKDTRGTGVAGLDVRIQIAGAHGTRAERGSKDGSVHDDGGGRYSFEFVPSEVGGHALVARAAGGNQESAVSEPVAFEVVRDGEEGIRVDAAGTSFVYQIRYVWLPGEAHASDSAKVTLVFEVMRGIPRGSEIDWSRPWQNGFDHVEAAREPTVIIESEGVREQLVATYKGLGVYRIERAFPAAEVGAKGRDYRVRLTFVDPAHGAAVTHAEPYHLRVLP